MIFFQMWWDFIFAEHVQIDFFFFFRFWGFFFSRDLLLPQIPLSLSNQTVDMHKRLRNQNETLRNKQYDDWKRTFKEIKQWENKSGRMSQNPCLTLESSDWRPRITIGKSKTKQIGYLNTKKQNKRKVCLSAVTHHVIFPSVLTHGLVKAETHGTNIWIETEIQKDTNVLPSFGCEPCEKTQERRRRLATMISGTISGFGAGKMTECCRVLGGGGMERQKTAGLLDPPLRQSLPAPLRSQALFVFWCRKHRFD